MEIDLKITQWFEFKVSKEDIEFAAIHMPSREEQLKGYFIEINNKEYKIMSLIDQLCKDRGTKIPKIVVSPYEIGLNFQKLGFKVFRRVSLSSSKNALLLQNINNIHDLEFKRSKKIHSDRLMINNYKFTNFKIINLEGMNKFSPEEILKHSLDSIVHPENIFGGIKFIYLDTYEKIELKSGLLLITVGTKKDQKILFLLYDTDLKKFMNDLLSVIEVIDNLFAQFFSTKKEEFNSNQRHFEELLSNQMEKWKEEEINPMSGVIGLEIADTKYNLDTDKASFSSFMKGERYNFYYHPLDEINKAEMKELLANAKPLWNRKLRRLFRGVKDNDVFDWQEDIYKLDFIRN